MLDTLLGGQAVANDLELAWGGCRALVVTGPNMGGKSSLIRQAALLAIMAQVLWYCGTVVLECCVAVLLCCCAAITRLTK